MNRLGRIPFATEGAPAGPRPIHPPTLVELAHEQLLSMLVTMQILPGARVGIDAVARKLGISQTPIREALTQLEAEGLVYKTPNIGYRASEQMTEREVDDLYALRLLIEPYAAARAAESIGDQDQTALEKIAEEMSSIQTRSDVAYARFAEADAMLHRLIATASGNRLIAETIDRLHVHLHIFRFLYNTNAPEEAAEEHARVIEAVIAREPATAEQAMREHLNCSRARINLARSRLARQPDETLEPAR